MKFNKILNDLIHFAKTFLTETIFLTYVVLCISLITDFILLISLVL